MYTDLFVFLIHYSSQSGMLEGFEIVIVLSSWAGTAVLQWGVQYSAQPWSKRIMCSAEKYKLPYLTRLMSPYPLLPIAFCCSCLLLLCVFPFVCGHPCMHLLVCVHEQNKYMQIYNFDSSFMNVSLL